MREPRERNVFRWEGDYWTIVFDGKTIRLRDSKGMRYLATLLRRPGEHVPSADLEAAAVPGSQGRPRLARPPEKARLTVTKGIKTALQRIGDAHPSLGQHLEATVRRGYRCRYFPDPRRPIVWEE